MEKYKQLEFFPKTKEEEMYDQIVHLTKQCDNVRKGIYAKHAKLCKDYEELKHEFSLLKQAICRGSFHDTE